MKKIFKDKIINIKNTDLFDNRFLFDKLIRGKTNQDIEIIYLSDLLEKRKNTQILQKVKEKPAMWSQVYSQYDELEIFKDLFEKSLNENKKIHIVWVTLEEEIKILEDYYEKLWFLRADINCFDPDFSIPLVTVSVKIENIMYRGSDYKALKNKIFFNPPIRESWQVKAMFKGINRWVIAWIFISLSSDLDLYINEEIKFFLQEQIKQEHILAITMSKILCYNLEEIWFVWEKEEIIIKY